MIVFTTIIICGTLDGYDIVSKCQWLTAASTVVINSSQKG